MRFSVTLGIFGLIVALASAFVYADVKWTHDSLRTVTVDELAALRTTGKTIVVDANGAETRQKYGGIPGALLLTHYADYDVAKQLPHDRSKKLVFYCANEQCMASHKAAQRAVDAGYADVSVLPAGIMGWKRAGQPTGPS